MLGKLIKYEFKSTGRIMWFLYAALIVIGALLGFALRIDTNDTSFMALLLNPASDSVGMKVAFFALIFIYFVIIMAVVIMTFILIITRFNKNLLGGEGYLMHTLPVRTENLVFSKLIVAVLWCIIGGLAGLLSAFFIAVTSGWLGLILESFSVSDILGAISNIFTGDFVLGLLMMFLAMISNILAFYFAMSIGNLANKNKFLWAVLAYVGIQIILSIISSIIGVGFGEFVSYFEDARRMMIIQIVQNLILSVLFFVGTDHILKNRLNLA